MKTLLTISIDGDLKTQATEIIKYKLRKTPTTFINEALKKLVEENKEDLQN